jgi:hypothetical protein
MVYFSGFCFIGTRLGGSKIRFKIFLSIGYKNGEGNVGNIHDAPIIKSESVVPDKEYCLHS